MNISPTPAVSLSTLQQDKHESQAKLAELKELVRKATGPRRRELISQQALEEKVLEMVDEQLKEVQEAVWAEQAAVRRADALERVPELIASVIAAQTPFATRMAALSDEMVALLDASRREQSATAEALVRDIHGHRYNDSHLTLSIVDVRAAVTGRSSADAKALAAMLYRIGEAFGFAELETLVEFNHGDRSEMTFEQAAQINVRTLKGRLS